MRIYTYWIILIIVTYVIVESVSYGGLYILSRTRDVNYEPVDVISKKHRKILREHLKGKKNYLVYNSKLGWTIKKNGTSKLYQANSSGVRSSKDYELDPPNNILRIATFGDSFTHCDNVGNDATWQAILESFDTDLEVMNFGVGGYGLDQSYLRYLDDGQQYKPHIVFIGFMVTNIFRNVNTFRPFYLPQTRIPLSKPRFTIKNGVLSLIPNHMHKLEDYDVLLSKPKRTLSKISANDYYYQNRYKSSLLDFSPTIRVMKIIMNNYKDGVITDDYYKSGIITNDYYNEISEPFKVTIKIFDVFYVTAINNNSFPVILIMPPIEDIKRYQKHRTKRYQPLLSYFDSKGYQYIDLLDAFDKAGKDYDANDLFIRHYSPFANKLIARYIQDYLSKNDLYGPERVVDQLIKFKRTNPHNASNINR